MPMDRYLTYLPNFGSSLELTGEASETKDELLVAEKSKFLIATLSLPTGRQPRWNMGRLSIEGPKEVFKTTDDENAYVSERGNLFIINKPGDGLWEVRYDAGDQAIPVGINFSAFYYAGTPIGPIPPSPGPPPPHGNFRCRGCKMITKALALAIVAAASLPAIPAALIAAVAAYLGVAVAVAAAFITSVLGDTADAIADALCKAVNLCP